MAIKTIEIGVLITLILKNKRELERVFYFTGQVFLRLAYSITPYSFLIFKQLLQILFALFCNLVYAFHF